jgi:anti-sigma B factor antagonist
MEPTTSTVDGPQQRLPCQQSSRRPARHDGQAGRPDSTEGPTAVLSGAADPEVEADATNRVDLLTRPGLICEPEPGIVRRVHGEGAPAFEITFSQHNGAVVMAAAGEVDLATAPWLRQQLLHLLSDSPASLVLSLEEVPFMDASGLGTLAVVDRCAHLVGTRFRIAGPSRPVQKVLAITGMDKSLESFPTLAEALADVPPGNPPALGATAGT